MKEIIVLSTTDSLELGEKIASILVEEREAACVNIIPGMRSIYRWNGKVCNEKECLLVIKCAADGFEAVRNRIRQLHTYQVPEIIALPVTAGDPDYLAWLHASNTPDGD
jgi:periplasmic divalent cation tolerance protein